jgi:chorismate mutase/prephenate dehydratase
MSSQDSKKNLDTIDAKIIELLAERLKAIGESTGDTTVEPDEHRLADRDQEVLKLVRSEAARVGMETSDAERVYRQILTVSRKIGGPEAAFQGEDGSYAQEVALNFFGRSTRTRQCDTIDEVFHLVQDGSLKYGIVPVENSQEGSTGHSYDLLLESEVMVCAEAQVRTSYCLIANKATSLNNVKKVYSHPQALGQCQAFLRHLGFELLPTYNTAASVKMIKEKRLTDCAAVAGEDAPYTYDMKVLAHEIEDNPRNSTRFFIIGKNDAPPTGRDKTSIVVLLKHEPGTVYRAVKQFADRGINLTKVETRPTRKTAWEYNFYLDFEGHRQDTVIKEALAELEKVCLFLKVLGSYPRAKTM